MPEASIDLAKIATASPRIFAKGDHIIRAGAPAAEMFVIRSGRVLISLDGKPLEEAGPGGVVGEMALLDRSARSAEAVALEPTEVVPISERLFLVLVQDTPGFALEVLRVLTRRLRHMNEVAFPQATATGADRSHRARLRNGPEPAWLSKIGDLT